MQADVRACILHQFSRDVCVNGILSQETTDVLTQLFPFIRLVRVVTFTWL